MKNLILAFMISIPLITSAQRNNDSYDMVSDGIIKLYNNNNYSEIYSLYSPMLKKFQSEDESHKLLEQVMSRYGKISNKKFIKFQQNYGIFECQTEKGKMNMRISLDDQNRLVALHFGSE